jgi:hypothetical protein
MSLSAGALALTIGLSTASAFAAERRVVDDSKVCFDGGQQVLNAGAKVFFTHNQELQDLRQELLRIGMRHMKISLGMTMRVPEETDTISCKELTKRAVAYAKTLYTEAQ